MLPSLDLVPGGEASMSDLPPGIELGKLTGLGLADLEDKLANYDKNTCIGRYAISNN